MRRWLVAALLLAGCTEQAPDAPPEPTTEASGAVTNVTWSFGQADGQFARRWRLDADEARSCNVTAAAMGRAPDLRPTLGLFIAGSADPLDDQATLGRGQGTIGYPRATVNAGPLEQSIPFDELAWADDARGTFGIAAGGNVSVTVAASSLVWMAPDQRPGWADDVLNDTSAAVRIACDGPVRIQQWAAEHVILFEAATLRGGAGAALPGALDMSEVTLAGSAGFSTQAPVGFVFVSVLGDLLLQHAAAGAIIVTTPAGETMLLDHPGRLAQAIALGEPLEYIFEEGPGTYSVQAVHVSIELLGELKGALFDLHPVNDTVEPAPQS